MTEKRGRPSVFNETVREKIIELALQGKTDKQIANIIGVSRKTIQIWKGSKQDLGISLREAKSVADELVEASLFRKAIGYSHPAEKIMMNKDGEILRAQYVEHYAPDSTAAIFWLKNRKPEEWRDQQEHKHSGKISLEDLVGGTTDKPDEEEKQ